MPLSLDSLIKGSTGWEILRRQSRGWDLVSTEEQSKEMISIRTCERTCANMRSRVCVESIEMHSVLARNQSIPSPSSAAITFNRRIRETASNALGTFIKIPHKPNRLMAPCVEFCSSARVMQMHIKYLCGSVRTHFALMFGRKMSEKKRSHSRRPHIIKR